MLGVGRTIPLLLKESIIEYPDTQIFRTIGHFNISKEYFKIGILIALLITLSYGILFVLDFETAFAWGTGDGPVEWVGAIGLAVAGGGMPG